MCLRARCEPHPAHARSRICVYVLKTLRACPVSNSDPPGVRRRSVEPLNDSELRAFLADEDDLLMDVGAAVPPAAPHMPLLGPPIGADSPLTNATGTASAAAGPSTTAVEPVSAGSAFASAFAAVQAPERPEGPALSSGALDSWGGGSQELDSDSGPRTMSGVGPPIGVSLPDSDLDDLRAFIRSGLPSLNSTDSAAASEPPPAPGPPPPTPAPSANLDQLLGAGVPTARGPSGGPFRQFPLGAAPAYVAAGGRQGGAHNLYQGAAHKPGAQSLQRSGTSGGAGQGMAVGIQWPAEAPAVGARQQGADVGAPGSFAPPQQRLTAAVAGMLEAPLVIDAEAPAATDGPGPVMEGAALRQVRPIWRNFLVCI